jgi:hypothetical protein
VSKPRVVHEHVDGHAPAVQVATERLGRTGYGQVEGHGHGVGIPAQLAGQSLEAVRAPCHQDDALAASPESPGQRNADAARGTRDDGAEIRSAGRVGRRVHVSEPQVLLEVYPEGCLRRESRISSSVRMTSSRSTWARLNCRFSEKAFPWGWKRKTK